MKRTLGRSCAFKRTKHKEQYCGELCECECHKKIEWERKLLDLVDNKESGYVDFAELIRETISNREQEIAEEVHKIKKELVGIAGILESSAGDTGQTHIALMKLGKIVEISESLLNNH